MQANPYSIRRRLVVAIILGSTVILGSAVILLDAMIGREMQQMFDTRLLDKARALESLTDRDEKGIEFDFTDTLMPEFKDPENPQYFQLWLDGKGVFARSQSLGDKDLPHDESPLNRRKIRDIELPDGRPGRLVQTRFVPRLDIDAEKAGNASPPSSQPVTLVYARERASLERHRLKIRLVIAAALLLVLATLAAMVMRIVGKGLSPVTRLADQVRRIDEKALDQRIVQQHPPSLELAPIERQINQLLERIENAFNREKQFSADLAHELRTPLAELKSLAEVAQRHPADRDTIVTFFDDVENITVQMERILDTLRQLAREETESTAPPPSHVALSELIEGIRRRRAEPLAGKGFTMEIPADIQVWSDRDALEIIIGNLFDNAIAYSPPHGPITVTATREQGHVAIRISNPAGDLRRRDLPHMSARFWRKEASRNDNSHSGLGLALVEALSKRIGATVMFRLDDTGVLTVELTLPDGAPAETGGE